MADSWCPPHPIYLPYGFHPSLYVFPADPNFPYYPQVPPPGVSFYPLFQPYAYQYPPLPARPPQQANEVAIPMGIPLPAVVPMPVVQPPYPAPPLQVNVVAGGTGVFHPHASHAYRTRRRREFASERWRRSRQRREQASRRDAAAKASTQNNTGTSSSSSQQRKRR